LVKLNKIYTRTGDNGTTGLVSGPRREKFDLRVEAYGTVDELDVMLIRIQNDLFDLGSDLATPDTGEELSYEPLRIIEAQADRLEREIDTLNGELDPLKSFVLPGGTAAAAHLHLARTISRRAERQMVELSRQETIGAAALKYINRLSDFLFVAARFANDRGQADILWVPGKHR